MNKKEYATAIRAGDFKALGCMIGALVSEKNRQYGDSIPAVADCLQLLFPHGVRPQDYHSVVAISRVIEKLCRIAEGNRGEENAWADVAGYGILMLVNGENNDT